MAYIRYMFDELRTIVRGVSNMHSFNTEQRKGFDHAKTLLYAETPLSPYHLLPQPPNSITKSQKTPIPSKKINLFTLCDKAKERLRSHDKSCKRAISTLKKTLFPASFPSVYLLLTCTLTYTRTKARCQEMRWFCSYILHYAFNYAITSKTHEHIFSL